LPSPTSTSPAKIEGTRIDSGLEGGGVRASLGSVPTPGSATKIGPATPPPVAPGLADGPAQQLRQRLQAAGLDKLITVEERGNQLVVDGLVGSAAYSRWREVKDALMMGKLTAGPGITDLVKTSTAANVPNGSIASIVLGAAPYVLSTSGRRARIGEVLDDGWTVESINAETVTLRRGQAVNRINPADGFPK
jgi:hypothetical protein